MSASVEKQVAFIDAINHALGKSIKSESAILAKRKSIERRIDEEKLENKSKKILKSQQKKKYEADHVKPNPLDLDREKKLRKIATRGVVKLFNAVYQQKRIVDGMKKQHEILSSSAQRQAMQMAKHSMKQFLGTPTMHVKKKTDFNSGVKESSKLQVAASDDDVDEEFDSKEQENQAWNAIKDDYMTEADIKDWDML